MAILRDEQGNVIDIPTIKGEDGYTPIKGKDYFTEEDKTEMVNSVLTAMPVAEGVGF